MRAYLLAQNGSRITVPACEGLRALGYSVVQGVPLLDAAAHLIPKVSLLVLTGMRRHQRQVREAYGAQVSCVMFDLPHIRGTQDVRLYRDSHAWLPLVEGMPSRRDRLPVTVAPKRRGRQKKEPDGYVLVVGQMPHDSSHGMDQPQLEKWAEGVFALVRESLPGVEIVWRPHPKTGSKWHCNPKGYDRISNSHQEPITDAFAGARLVCVYNSTAGLEALIAGKPVVAWGSSCYGSLCTDPRELAQAEHPGREAVEGLLERVAWTQWSLDEITTGEPFRFVLDQMGAECSAVAA